MADFETRHGIQRTSTPIRITNDAPPIVRERLVEIVQQLGGTGALSEALNHLANNILMPPRWSNMPLNLALMAALSTLQWYEVYHYAEDFYRIFKSHDDQDAAKYERFLNQTFVGLGIGWQMQSGTLVRRGNDIFEATLHDGISGLDKAGLRTSASELREAMSDLSKRPEPDITGALQHAGAGLECALRELCNDPKATLGVLLKDHPGIFPRPLDNAIEKIWGFASDRGRHLTEGYAPDLHEALFVVQIAAAASSYAAAKLRH